MPSRFTVSNYSKEKVLHSEVLIKDHGQSTLSGKTIVQISDLHYGPSTTDQDIQLIVSLTKNLCPDMIVMTGDYVQKSRIGIRHRVATGFGPELVNWKDFRRKVRFYAQSLGNLIAPLQAPLGIHAVFGNHDHHEGLGSIKKYLGSKVNWINNISFEPTSGLTLSGIDDLNVGEPDLASAVKQMEPFSSENFKLLLCHNPDIVLADEKDLLKNYDLVLCGHTHGGQLRLPFLPPLVTRTTQKDYVAGLGYFKHSGGGQTPLYVNQGGGFGAIRLRTFCPREITILKFS